MKINDLLKQFIKLPDAMQILLRDVEKFRIIAKKYVSINQFLFLGRCNMVGAALEGALKLKEIAYSFSTGYPAGEMKHSPIALVDENCLTVALCNHKKTFPKMMTNVLELKTRVSKVLIFANKDTGFIFPDVDDIFFVPQVCDELSPIIAGLVTHLFAYFVALERKLEIDRPRNLAKSVTVD